MVLYKQLEDIIPDIDIWFWGHEHSTQVDECTWLAREFIHHHIFSKGFHFLGIKHVAALNPPPDMMHACSFMHAAQTGLLMLSIPHLSLTGV